MAWLFCHYFPIWKYNIPARGLLLPPWVALKGAGRVKVLLSSLCRMAHCGWNNLSLKLGPFLFGNRLFLNEPHWVPAGTNSSRGSLSEYIVTAIKLRKWNIMRFSYLIYKVKMTEIEMSESEYILGYFWLDVTACAIHTWSTPSVGLSGPWPVSPGTI